MAADALAPGVARPSAAIILTISDTNVMVLLETESEQPPVFKYWEGMYNSNTYFYYLKQNSMQEVNKYNVFSPWFLGHSNLVISTQIMRIMKISSLIYTQIH